MGKKNKGNSTIKETVSTLNLGQYNDAFENLEVGKTKSLKDPKSEKNSAMPIKVNSENVYITEPDGKLIPNMQGQQKCDYLIFCQNESQVCLVELKGQNISIKSSYNPYDQIRDTINFLKSDEDLKSLVSGSNEKHAFIVSPGRQKIPNGIDTKERQLWKSLVQVGKKTEVCDLVHYVKVTKADRYSDNKQQIICSSASPIPIPYAKTI